MQSSCPIAFASKTLTDIETCHVNIEWECLSVCFSLEKFQTYIYGRHVMVQNDHKKLEMIPAKVYPCSPPHFSRCFCTCRSMTILSNISLARKMVLANCLSHFPSHSNFFPIPTVQNIQHVQLSNAELDIIQGSMEHDLVYSTVYHLTLKRLVWAQAASPLGSQTLLGNLGRTVHWCWPTPQGDKGMHCP